jgi:5-methylcytosine-specific restriction endonuclease McrA
MNPRLLVIDTLFSPNVHGVSRWVTIEECMRAGLPWSTNGNTRNNIVWNDDRYVWKFDRGYSRKILAIKMNGLSEESVKIHRPIRMDIRKTLKDKSCVVCGSHSDIVIDHKNDLYNDPRVLDVKTQVIEDFQPLCNHCNLQKRSVAVKTRQTGKRYPATNIPSMAVFGVDFTSGDETYDLSDVNAMVGTFWHDPVKFAENILLQK